MNRRLIVGIIIVSVTLFILVCSGFLYSQRLACEEYEVRVGLPTEITVCQLSDIHFPYEGVSADRILAGVGTPDIIILSGDVFDGKAKDLDTVESFLFKLRKIAPVYAVLGNHEIGSPLLDRYKALCREYGIELLINARAEREIKGVKLSVVGLNDGNLLSDKNFPDGGFTCEDADIRLLIAHRPELYGNYCTGDFDAVFCGHAHGGQVRIFGRGLYAPDQGWLPKYTSGEYRDGGTDMFVSRGLGDGYSALRILNPYNINIVKFM